MEILKELLKSTFDKRLERLEKRGKEHCADLEYCGKYYIKQGKEVERLTKIDIDEILLKRTRVRDNLKRDISAQTIKPKHKEQIEDKERIRNKTPVFHPQIERSRSKTPKRKKNNVNTTTIRPKKAQIELSGNKENNDNLNKTIKLTRNKTPERIIKTEGNEKKHIVINKRKGDMDNNIKKEVSPKPKSKPNQVTISPSPLSKVIKKPEVKKKEIIIASINNEDDNSINSSNENIMNHRNEPSQTVIRLSTMDTKKVFLKEYMLDQLNIQALFKDHSNSGKFDPLYSYLDFDDKINLYSTNKCFKTNLYELILFKKKQFEERNDITSTSSLDNKLDDIQTKYSTKDLYDNLSLFELSRGSAKVIELLNEQIYNKLFHHLNLKPPSIEIILPFRILFQLADKEDVYSIRDDKFFWKKVLGLFSENKDKKTGVYIKELVEEFHFSNEIIDMIKRLTYGKLTNFNPNYYSKICGTTGLIIYPIKDALEYCGVIPHKTKNNPAMIYNSLCYLKGIEERMNAYIEYLSQ